jgi:hypothetical protein
MQGAGEWESGGAGERESGGAGERESEGVGEREREIYPCSSVFLVSLSPALPLPRSPTPRTCSLKTPMLRFAASYQLKSLKQIFNRTSNPAEDKCKGNSLQRRRSMT